MSEAASIIDIILSNPLSTIVMFIQFVLGAALGYTAIKVFKYIVTLIIILVMGTFLSIWSLDLTPLDVLSTLKLGVEAMRNLALLLGLMTVGPTSIGFIVGVLVALFRK